VDAAELARRQEEQDRTPFIFVREFKIEYEPKPDGTFKEVEWVAWGKKGVQNPSITNEKISTLQKYPDNPIWGVIKPFYEQWKKGQEAVVDGTPLSAWSGITPELKKVLEPANIRSVEDLAKMEDSAIQRLGVPNLRRKQQEARSFLEAQRSTSGIAAENLKLKEQVEALMAQVTELRAAVEADAPDDKKRRKPKAA